MEKKLRKKCNKKKKVNMNTATLRTHDGYNGIGEATVDEFHFLHEIVKPFHIEIPISVNQLRDAAIFLHSSLHSKNNNNPHQKLCLISLFFLILFFTKPKKKKVSRFQKVSMGLGFRISLSSVYTLLEHFLFKVASYL